MATVELVMPKMGESIMEGTVLKWLKQPGEAFEQEDFVLEVATDKVDTEVPAPFAGTLKEILAQEGEVVEVGKPLALIETVGEAEIAGTDVPAPAAAAPQPVAEAPAPAPAATAAVSAPAAPANGSGSRFYSPLVMNIAKQEGIGGAELETIPGTGKEGRVTKKDILAYLETRHAQPAPSAQPASAPAAHVNGNGAPAKPQAPAVSVSGEDEIVEMDRMRKMIAQRMVDSVHTSPHVTSFVEADVTNIVKWRNSVKKKFAEQHGAPITYTPVFMHAVVRALQDYPGVNASIDGDSIVYRKRINLGMAVALPSGNLIVPVIKDANHLNLTGIALKVHDLAKRARENKLKAEDLEGGTYTVSNVGSFGNVMGTPIIMQPQVGILALGAVRKKPAVVETPDGDFIGIRHMMFLSHSYDHRIVDGALGGMFVKRVAEYLESFDMGQGI